MDSSDRGTGWVVSQFVAMGLVMASILVPPRWPEGAQTLLGALGGVLAVAGATIAVWASRALGRGLTPFPLPSSRGELVTNGPFRLVRHPVYAGGLVLFLGWSLYAGVVALAFTLLLGVLWDRKARLEERHLRHRYPGYEAYARRVRGRIVPGIG